MKSSSMASSFAAASLILLISNSIFTSGEELSALRGRYVQSLNKNNKLQANPLRGGDCEWTQPSAVPEDLDLWKSLLVGFPSADKRLVYLQMEAMTGFLARDDWDFYFNGQSNAPFIKTNYPHSSGVWSFDSKADQVVLVVQNIRRAMAEYSEVMAKMNFSRFKDNINEFFAWRDHNLLIELYKYGWQIDFWMEDGLYRDPYTHSVIDQAAFEHYHQPEAPPLVENGYITFCNRLPDKANHYVTIKVPFLDAQKHMGEGDYLGSCEDAMADPEFTKNNKISVPSDDKVRQDPKCKFITSGCKPKLIVSGDQLRDSSRGPAEEDVIGSFLLANEKTAKHVTSRENWACLWDKLIVKNEGNVDPTTREANFSEFMLRKMIDEIQRLAIKYSSSLWEHDINAKRLVGLLREQLPMLQEEATQVASGSRPLAVKDIYGPGERIDRFGKTTKKV